MENGTASKKKIAAISVSAVLLLAAAILLTLFLIKGCAKTDLSMPAVIIETPEKKSADDHDPFLLEVRLTALGDAIYPASSFSISFDSSKLEFLGMEEGNVLVTDSSVKSGYKMPQWNVDVSRSNEIGQINLMYLDMTGGKNAFVKDALDEDGNIIFFLCFRLRGSAKAGDILEVSFDDAVFAASDETMSLASSNNTLKTTDGRIVVGDKSENKV